MGIWANPDIPSSKGLLVLYCAFLSRKQYSGLKDCRVLEYDTEQQVSGYHLLYAWETLVGVMSQTACAVHARGSV